jgi:ubiquinone/menaquinone biosynthesis C-methylase UbiE
MLAHNTSTGAAAVGEIDRIRKEYARRAREIPTDFYSWSRPVNLFFHVQVVRAAIRALVSRGLFPLEGRTAADIGCGTGTWLLEFLQWGAEARNVYGIDLDDARIERARRRLPGANLEAGDARHLPWPSGIFDVVTQFTMFTSILEPDLKRAIAAEMLRVLKPGGAIIWYDFIFDNPRNPNVRGIKAPELRSLFPRCAVALTRLTLAPPLARLVVPVSWNLAELAEKVPFLRTHCLSAIVKAA